jgi:NAD(P) transhydrogenase alpha subunit
MLRFLGKTGGSLRKGFLFSQ